jgi:hypothetical protein
MANVELPDSAEIKALVEQGRVLAQSLGQLAEFEPGFDAAMISALVRRLTMVVATERSRAERMQRTFDLRWDSDHRAIERWRAGEPDPFVRSLVEAAGAVIAAQHDGQCLLAGFPDLAAALDRMPASFRLRYHDRALVRPDHADLICWLLGQIEAMEAAPTPDPVAEAARVSDALDEVWFFVGPELGRRASDALARMIALAQAQTRKIAALEAKLMSVAWTAALDSRTRPALATPGELGLDKPGVSGVGVRDGEVMRFERRPALEGLECPDGPREASRREEPTP